MVILDVEGSEPKKIVEKKKHLWVFNVLKKSISITTIIKHILDLGVNLTVGELLALVLTIEN